AKKDAPTDAAAAGLWARTVAETISTIVQDSATIKVRTIPFTAVASFIDGYLSLAGDGRGEYFATTDIAHGDTFADGSVRLRDGLGRQCEVSAYIKECHFLAASNGRQGFQQVVANDLAWLEEALRALCDERSRIADGVAVDVHDV